MAAGAEAAPRAPDRGAATWAEHADPKRWRKTSRLAGLTRAGADGPQNGDWAHLSACGPGDRAPTKEQVDRGGPWPAPPTDGAAVDLLRGGEWSDDLPYPPELEVR
ncbi:hypothetical protein NDU88_002644 [Pleurodeles waltl]|uniref:Uncharacterized protein n=1 Tax=Pleurodeles waltl TaxID=8319 RepID=A0AAV7UY79_PLEWA|nr:hypothetical protein NDU88_002644 [Pleurodeles waltl]